MKILIATPLYPPDIGGPATYTKLLEKHLPDRGFEVSVLPFSTVRHLPSGIRHAAYFIRCILRARRVDLIYAQDMVSVGLPAYCAAVLTRRKFIVRVPGDFAWEQGRQRFGVKEDLNAFVPRLYGWRVELLHGIQGFVVRNADLVVAPSEYLKTRILEWGAEKNRVVRIFNGIELPVPTKPPQKRPKGFLIVSVGRLVQWKGMDGIVRCLSKHNGWKAVIVGDGPERQELESLAHKLGVHDRIIFAGAVSRPEALGWVVLCDAFVLNSSYEGLSHQLIEAMSLNVPIVATRIGGNPELIEHGVQGLLVPAYDDEALQKAIEKIEEDPERARTMAIAAEARAHLFSVDKMLTKLVSLLKGV